MCDEKEVEGCNEKEVEGCDEEVEGCDEEVEGCEMECSWRMIDTLHSEGTAAGSHFDHT